MAAEPVTADQYPHLDTFTLNSTNGQTITFLGYITATQLPCPKCGDSGSTVTVYRGPQYGLAFDNPETPYDVTPVDLELSWCNQHGTTKVRLLNQDGTNHTGP